MIYDITVYGASGFTGRLVAEYLSQTYPDLSFAMAGRSAEKLEAVRDEMGIPASVGIVVADSSDPDSLTAMCEGTKCVITTVGPYQLYGTPLVAACAASGTDYVDLSGEPAWMHDTIAEFSDTAEESGARIVHSCGFDSVPFDMGVYFLQQQAKDRFGAPCARVRGRVRAMKGTFSGGTAASLTHTLKRAAKEPEIIGWLKDPFSLAPGFDGPEQPHGAKPLYEADLSSWSAPFIMASINTKNIHRSNFLLGHPYGEDFVYDEMMFTGDGERGEQVAKAIAAQSSKPFGDNPPEPGEGPSKEERENGYYDILYVGETADGKTLRASVSGKRDPGYGSTSRMIAECALCLVREDLSTGGGLYTPAPAFGDTLIRRLEDAGVMRFRVEE